MYIENLKRCVHDVVYTLLSIDYALNSQSPTRTDFVYIENHVHSNSLSSLLKFADDTKVFANVEYQNNDDQLINFNAIYQWSVNATFGILAFSTSGRSRIFHTVNTF